MNKNAMLAIAEKVKSKAVDCHRLHKTSLTDCEEQYVDYYKHCLKFFGCEITENVYNRYLNFIVCEPDSLNKTVGSCVDSYHESETKWIDFDVSLNGVVFLTIILTAFLFGMAVG